MRVSSAQRLPLLELALPQLKRRSRERQTRLLRVIEALSVADGRVDPFEYLLGRLVRQYLWEAENPRRSAPSGGASLADLAAEARTVLATLARHGPRDEPARERALGKGLERAGIGEGESAPGDDWVQALDRALDRLDRLAPSQKEAFVAAMIETVTADEVVSAEELELLRAVCAGLHVPIPLISGPASEGQD